MLISTTRLKLKMLFVDTLLMRIKDELELKKKKPKKLSRIFLLNSQEYRQFYI